MTSYTQSLKDNILKTDQLLFFALQQLMGMAQSQMKVKFEMCVLHSQK